MSAVAYAPSAEIPHFPDELGPLQRLQLLCDAGSLRVIRSAVFSRRTGIKARHGDGVVGAAGRVRGRPVFCYAQDSGCIGGSLGEAHAETIVRILRLASEARIPVVSFVESAGARMQEGATALGGYARIFYWNVALSGRVPQISIVTRTSAGGGCYSPALTDFVVMTEQARMFLTGPKVVNEVLGEQIDPVELGGPKLHASNGVAHFVRRDEASAASLARELLSYLPQSAGESVPVAVPEEPLSGDPAAPVPGDGRSVYDMRDVVRRLVDGGTLLEVAPRWARNLITGFARLEGRAVGVLASQPRYLGGVLDIEASQKGARFVHTCNAYGVPLVVLVDTPGFMPGGQQERGGVIRQGAKLLHAFAQARVPRVTVVVRKAYGGAYITMNSKDLGADLSFAWPAAEIGIMGALQAVKVIHHRELEACSDPEALQARLAAEYTREHLSAWVAAREGVVDEVVVPAETRTRLAWALATLEMKAEYRGTVASIAP
jgi:acetyl-CoA carboxylase carboxyltransferase component